MPFLKSLISIEGHDNGRRFLAISAVFYFVLIVFLPIFQIAGILVFLLIVVSTAILSASAIRRIHDAGFITAIAAIPIVIFYFNVFGLTYFDHPTKWILLLIGVSSTIIISTISNIHVRHSHDYQWGYHGPINSSDNNKNNDLDRVEPTLATSVFDSLNSDDIDHQQYNSNINATSRNVIKETTQSYTNSHSFKEQFIHWYRLNKNLANVSAAGSLIIIFLIIIIPSALNNTDTDEIPVGPKDQTIKQFVKERNHKLEMPDNFWLMLDQNNALTIGWEGDPKKDGSYWSAMTGKGDDSCIDLYFSLGDNIRTLQVTIKASEDYYADFSPVDTKLIIQSIANKDRFKLCGYEFVLKGTRSRLRKHEFYRDYINVD